MVINCHLQYNNGILMRYFKPIFLTTFFFISGYLFQERCSYKQVLEHRTRTLLLPFLLLGGILIITNQIVTFNESVPFIDRVKGLLFQYGLNQLLWFITVSGYRLQTISEFMYRTRHIKEQGGYIPLPKAWCSDHASVISLAKNGGIATCNKFLLQFRMSGLNISTGDSKYVIEKVEAQVQYTHMIEQFVKDEPIDVQLLILRVRRDKIRDVLTVLLINATWHDFFFLCRNRNSEKYMVPSRCFLRAVYGKVANFLKRIR